MPQNLKVNVAPVAVLALVAAAILVACGGGGGSSTAAGSGGSGGGGGGGTAAITFTGLVWNSPVDGVTVTATCADGTAGGTANVSLGTYSLTVSCSAANFPIVIATTSDGLLAGPDLQFGTPDDYSYRLAERSPLKVAIGTGATAAANITALSTLAAQPIEDKIVAYKAAPASASKPTLADVQAAERNAAFALGLVSTDVQKANPLADPQLARIFAQFLEAIAVTRALSPASTSAEDVMKTLAQAAQLGGTGGAGTAGTLFKTEADGLNSFDLQTSKAALTTAAAAITGNSLGSSSTQMTTVNSLLTDVQAVEPSIKAIGTEAEQVIRVISSLPSVPAFDPAKANLGALASDIGGALPNPSGVSGSAAALMAKVTSEAMRQAGLKAQEIEGSTTIPTVEKANRKRTVFAAAEAIRSAQEYDIILKSTTATLSQDDVARAIAQVSLAVSVAGDLLKTAAIADIVNVTANKSKSSVAGMAARVRSDIGTQIASKSKADLGDLKSLNAQSVLGAAQVTTIGANATGILSLLTDFPPPPASGDLAVRASVGAVVESISSSTNLSSARAAIQSTAGSLTSSLNGAMTQGVTVGSAVNVAVSTLPSDVQARLLTLAAHTLIGLAKLDYSSLPAIPSAASAMTSAAAVVSKTLAATKTQSITLGAPPSVVVGGAGTLVAIGGASGNAVTFSTSTPGVCSVAANTVTGVSAGSCAIAADQAGNASYLAAAQVTRNITVGKGSQAITFGALSTLTVGGSGILSATGGASGSAVIFSSTTPAVCTVSGSAVAGVSAGSCVIAADQAGNANYAAAAEVTQTVTVGKASQTITFGVPPALAVGGSGTLSAAGGASGNAVIFTSTSPGVCTVSGNTVTGISAGTCVIVANQAGNATYNAAVQATQTISLGQLTQVIVMGAAPSVAVGGSGSLGATGGASGNPVVFGTTTPATCTVSGSVVVGVGAGACVVTANQAGNANFTAATQVTQSITVGKGSQSITFGSAPSVAVGGTGTVTATGGSSGNPIAFGSSTPAICTVSGSTVTGVAAGTCVITADQVGSNNYLPATEITQTVGVTGAVLGFSGVCQVQLASAIGYVTGVASAPSCVRTVMNIDGYGATVSIGPAVLISGRTAVDFSVLATCDPFGAPPTPLATTLTACKK